ncbi:MAG: sn-glycerol-1-phosphate dehydrogenase [Clostridiales bacterium]|nr:sn-glycerol-1-phosphate dehydrogenase [Clostridiales bacterium]
MNQFSGLSIEALLDPKGFDCACGKHHASDLKYFKSGAGVIGEIPAVLEQMRCKYPFVVADPNTFEAAGRQVLAVLLKSGIPFKQYIIPRGAPEPDEWAVGAVAMAVDPACDILLCVGSGVLNDVLKVISALSGKPLMAVATAPSMDGYASSSSSMHVNEVKTSLYSHCPTAIIADTDILCKAPMRMIWAGFGDMIAKYVSICEWRMAHLIIDEYYCEEIARLIRRSVKDIMDNADRLASRDPAVIRAITEGLVLSGVAMSFAENSRPASGLEHYFSHMWEMMAPERGVKPDFHGIQVGVGTMTCLKLFDWIRTVKPDWEKGTRHMESFDPEAWKEEMRDIFGSTAPQIIEVEERLRKNDPGKHAKRLRRIVDNWDEILRCIDEELPDTKVLEDLMKDLGMPMTPADIGWDEKGAKDAYTGAREIRDKYLICSILWDLGLAKEARARVRAE